MELFSSERQREAFGCQSRYGMQEASYRNPTARNLFRVFDILRTEHAMIGLVNGMDCVQVTQQKINQYLADNCLATTNGVRAVIRQKLPPEAAEQERYLTVEMLRNERESSIYLKLYMTMPAETLDEKYLYSDFRRLGSSRVFKISRDGYIIKEGKNGDYYDDFGSKEVEWFVEGNNSGNSVSRAYQLLAHSLLGVGEVSPLRLRGGVKNYEDYPPPLPKSR